MLIKVLKNFETTWCSLKVRCKFVIKAKIELAIILFILLHYLE